jgi:tRNA threonylcarbamoyladenosine biosynthesis protein TsaB
VNKLLSIETSAESCSAALSVGQNTLEKFEHAPRLHAELILPMVRSLLADAELALGQLDGIAFGRGPGSFTSLRIGIGVVQGLARGADLPVVPVSSLAAVAQAALEQGASPGVRRVYVAMDARMQEVYTANFEVDADGLVVLSGEERVCPPGDVCAEDTAGIHSENTSGIWAAGNGFAVYPELEKLAGKLELCLPDCWPRAGTISRLAARWLENNKPLPAAHAQPVYIRNQVAIKPFS